MENPKTTYCLSLGRIAKELEVSNVTLINFLKKKGLFLQVPRNGRGIIIPLPLANRILGKKSNPPQKIDELEYDYPPKFIAQRIGITAESFRDWLEASNWWEVCFARRDCKGVRIPRSIALFLLDTQNGIDN